MNGAIGGPMIRHYKYIGYVVALLTAVLIASCGGASAPPVDLPAPITGQIDASGPSADGKSTITGSAGSVTGGTIVLAINENTATSSLWRVTDFLFPKAYATALPSVCDLIGRVCVIAADDGSFTMEIDAVAGDTIILVLIDESGVEISDRVTIAIPAGEGIAACGSGVEGKLVALTNVSGTAYAFYEGSADSANKIVIDGQEFQVPGCYAQDIAVYETGTDSIMIATVSSFDKKLWIGLWNNADLIMGLTYTLDITPYKVAFGGDSTQVIVGGIGGSVHLELISVADGSTINSLILPNTDLNSVVALDTVGPFADGGYLGMIVGSDGIWYYLTFFHTSSFANVTSSSEILLDMAALCTLYNPVVVDARFGIDTSAGDVVRFLFSDRVIDEPAFRSIQISTSGVTAITLGDNTSSFTELAFDTAYPAFSVLPTSTKYPHRFVQSSMGSDPTAYILTDDDYLWRITQCFDSVSVFQDFFSLSSVLLDPIAIAMDETGTSLIGGNSAGATTDLSSYISP